MWPLMPVDSRAWSCAEVFCNQGPITGIMAPGSQITANQRLAWRINPQWSRWFNTWRLKIWVVRGVARTGPCHRGGSSGGGRCGCAIDRAEWLVVLGGPIGVYEADRYPFLNDELAALRRRLQAHQPTLGICLGAQLMAQALGVAVCTRVAPRKLAGARCS